MTKPEEKAVQNFVADHYENLRFALPYSRKYQFWFFRQLTDLLQPSGRVLDNGCGTGHLAEVLQGLEIVGVDLSEKMVEKAKTRMKEVHVGRAEELPFPDESFDSIFCRSLLHHLERPELAVKECYRVLKPGGKIIFSDTFKNILTYGPREIMRKHSSHFSEEHKNFSKKEMLGYIEPYFKVEKIEYLGFLAYTFFGFPDVINFQRFIPAKFLVYPFMVFLEKFFSKLPLIKKTAANIAVVAVK